MQQLKAMNENVAKKVMAAEAIHYDIMLTLFSQIKDLQVAKGKTQFKSVAEVDAHIK